VNNNTIVVSIIVAMDGELAYVSPVAQVAAIDVISASQTRVNARKCMTTGYSTGRGRLLLAIGRL